MKYHSLHYLVKQIASCQSRPSDFLSILQKAKAILAEVPKDLKVQMVQDDFMANFELLINITSCC